MNHDESCFPQSAGAHWSSYLKAKKTYITTAV